ncbi:MAG: fibronectin type III domain-containing protein [Oscillospiraceae bacterium]
MKVVKRMCSLLIVMVIVFTSAFSVLASEINSGKSNSEEQTDLIAEQSEIIEPDYDNDPLYLKYAYSPMTMSVYGSSDLIHDSRFSNVKKVFGIDVSYFNSDIDWVKVKKSGIDFVIIRVGYRGYVNGALVVDSKFKEYIKEAKAAGLAVGVYFFTQAINTAEAREEAQFVLKQLNGIKLELPVYFDIEEVYYGSARLDNAHLSYNAKTNLCKAFCDTIQQAGYRAGVYASNNWLTNLINGVELAKKYDIWVAHYGNKTTYKNDYSMWQYTGQGYVSGVPTNVDMNVLYMSKAPEKVTDLKAVSTGSQAKLSWSGIFGAYGYAIYAKDLTTNKITEVCKTTSTSKTVAIPYAKTRFYVKAYYKIGNNYSYSGYSNGVSVSSKKVTDLKVASDIYYNQTGLMLTWTALSDASGYEIQMYDEDAGKYKIIGYTNENTYKVVDLEPCTTYRFRVRSYYNDDNSPVFDDFESEYGIYSNELYTGTKTEKTCNVKATVDSTSTVKVKWDKISQKCDGYQIVVYDCGSQKTFTAGWTSNKENSFVVKNLNAGSKYKIKVRGYYLYNGNKIPGVYSDYSEVITRCDAPENLKASKISASGCTLTWSKTYGADGYNVYEYVNDKYVLLGKCKGNSFTVKNLPAYTTHKFRVQAYKIFDSKEYKGTASKFLTVNLAVKPSVFSVGSYSDNSVTLKWKATSGADKYVVYLYNSSTKKYKAYKTVKTAGCTITNLKINTSYKVSVRAVYGKKYSAYSAIQTVATRCSTPSGVKFTKIGSTYQMLSWKKVSGATNYWIYKYNDKTKKYYKFKETGNVSSVTLTGLKRNAPHKYVVYAVKKTSLRTYCSKHSAVAYAWTKR